jgi:hypothetical protein
MAPITNGTSAQSSALDSKKPAPLALANPSTSKPPQEVLDVPRREAFAFDPIEDSIAAFSRGEFLVVMDDEGRENEGDLILSAHACSTEQMAWMIKHTRYVRRFCTPGAKVAHACMVAATSVSPFPKTGWRNSTSR